MPKLIVQWKNKHYECAEYDQNDELKILDKLFLWKTTVLLAKQTDSKNAQLPETFSEPFCCLVCGLVHKLGSGPDAFRLDSRGEVEAVIEIKATTTKQGFTDIKRTMDFDELYWLSFADFDTLHYKVYRLTKPHLENFVEASKTARDRATINLQAVVNKYGLQPIHQGYIGIVEEGSDSLETNA